VRDDAARRGALDVGRHDTAAGVRPRERGEVDSELAGQPPGRRRSSNRPPLVPVDRGHGLRPSGCGIARLFERHDVVVVDRGLGLRLRTVRASRVGRRHDLRKDRVHGHCLPGRDADLERSVSGRLDLDRRFVGLDLDHGLTLPHRGSVLHEPPRHLALLHRDRELLEQELGHARLPAHVRSTAATIASADG
jgi:hypothetical protein